MDRPPTAHRGRRALRRVLGTGAATLLAGCGGRRDRRATGDGGTAAPRTPTGTPEPPTAGTGGDDSGAAGDVSPPVGSPGSSGGSAATDVTTTGDPTARPTVGQPDLREANVMAVAYERRDGGYRFDVTLLHDDGERGYADWWQVETLDGERPGRRELLHAHGSREFTRSATVETPDGVTTVAVRGHDETHGYGGRAIVLDLPTGQRRVVDQGPEPRSFADG